MFKQWKEEKLEFFEDKDDATTKTSHAMNLSNEATVTITSYQDHI